MRTPRSALRIACALSLAATLLLAAPTSSARPVALQPPSPPTAGEGPAFYGPVQAPAGLAQTVTLAPPRGGPNLAGFIVAPLPPAPGGGGESRSIAHPAAPHAVLTVCRAGPPACDYATVQGAVVAAYDGDTIKVAAGTYTDVHGIPTFEGYPGAGGSSQQIITQVVYLDKVVTLQGGYTLTNWVTPDPIANPTTLDAGGQGRVLVVTHNAYVSGLRLTGGDAFGLGGDPGFDDVGGGVYAVIASGAVISGNLIVSNTAGLGAENIGGGVFAGPGVTLLNNVIAWNAADGGGGLFLAHRYDPYSVTVRGNTIAENYAQVGGGGVALFDVAAVLEDNTIAANHGGQVGGGAWAMGVGVEALITGNQVLSNTAGNMGGGMDIDVVTPSDHVTVRGNLFSHNVECGLWITTYDGTVLVEGNRFIANDGGVCSSYNGGDAGVTVTNNIIADNTVTGLYLSGAVLKALHNTIARNGDTGVLVGDGGQVFMTNTILVSHTIGIEVAGGGAASLEGTLWGSGVWGNGQDWGGGGTIVTGTVNLWVAPGFVDPAAGDYHLASGSAAVDAGVDAGITTDIDGDPRPAGPGYDIGADEYRSVDVLKEASADPALAGEVLTYTLRVANLGDTPLAITATDVLPALVSPTGVLSWTASIAPGDAWVQEVPVVVQAGYDGRLVNVLRVAVDDGTDWAYTHTVAVEADPLTVCPPGPPACGYSTIQAAVDDAEGGEEIWVAGGTYADVHVRLVPPGYHFPPPSGMITQVVYLTKSLAIRGGYDLTFADPPDPVANPTTLDAGGQGRGLLIAGTISPTIEGLRFTGGDAAGLGGMDGPDSDAGGGVYVLAANSVFSNNQVLDNWAEMGGGLYLLQSQATFTGNVIVSNLTTDSGGGIYLAGDSSAFLRNNRILTNTAGSGGGIYATNSSVTLEGNELLDNQADSSSGEGGGLYVANGTVTLRENTISRNTAGSGGGLFVIMYPLDPLNVIGNVITNNAAVSEWPPYGRGGGILTSGGQLTIISNTIAGNTATAYCAGLYLYNNSVTVRGNLIADNVSAGECGGLGLLNVYATAAIHQNTIRNNQAVGSGGGSYVFYVLPGGNLVFQENALLSNTAGLGGGFYMMDGQNLMLTGNLIVGNRGDYSGGGLQVDDSSYVTVEGNTVTSNTTALYGGGIYLERADNVIVDDNKVAGNMASDGGGLYLFQAYYPTILNGNAVTGNTAADRGGGLYFSDNVVLDNNLVADNRAGWAGSGLFVNSSSTLRHTTIARNHGGDGSGICVGGGTARLTDTILVSQTVGISATAGTTVILEGTLWGSGAWGNGQDWGGEGTIVTGTVNVWGDPAFVDPAAGDYHLALGSAAIDAGVDAGVVEDIDGDIRPAGVGFDIGADEYPFSLFIGKDAAPDPVEAGGVLTYTLHVANLTAAALAVTVTDILPAQVTPTGVLSWTAGLAPSGTWAVTYTVMVAPGYAGLLDNRMVVAADDGTLVVYTRTVTAFCDAITATAFAWTPPTPTAGLPVTFTGSASGTLPLTFTWSFGDGGTAAGMEVVHAFAAAGDYTVTLTATNPCGGAGVAVQHRLTVLAPPGWRFYLPLVLKGATR